MPAESDRSLAKRATFERCELSPPILTGIDEASPPARLSGMPLGTLVIVAPGVHPLVGNDGERASAAVARIVDLGYTVGSVASGPLEEATSDTHGSLVGTAQREIQR
jgi:isopentenyl diphosphate isomerase/L-lactate dehydrogenase-like FMN-dependent dehydrogenase